MKSAARTSRGREERETATMDVPPLFPSDARGLARTWVGRVSKVLCAGASAVWRGRAAPFAGTTKSRQNHDEIKTKVQSMCVTHTKKVRCSLRCSSISTPPFPRCMRPRDPYRSQRHTSSMTSPARQRRSSSAPASPAHVTRALTRRAEAGDVSAVIVIHQGSVEPVNGW